MSRLTPAASGILLMLGEILLFAAMDAQAKALSARYETMQVIRARHAGQMAVALAVLAPRVPALMRTRHLGLQLLRSGLLFVATFCFFTALGRMPPAERRR
ncbi:MAG: hypothetical protein ACOCYW_06340 [Roseicyclus sp.]